MGPGPRGLELGLNPSLSWGGGCLGTGARLCVCGGLELEAESGLEPAAPKHEVAVPAVSAYSVSHMGRRSCPLLRPGGCVYQQPPPLPALDILWILGEQNLHCKMYPEISLLGPLLGPRQLRQVPSPLHLTGCQGAAVSKGIKRQIVQVSLHLRESWGDGMFWTLAIERLHSVARLH